MAEKIVSVIIPVYNIREYVGDCIKSALNQTYKDIEIILVDDGATDGSGAICDEYAKEDPRVKVIHKENGGLMSAWSTGVKEAEGRYALFIDGDDWIDERMVEELLKYASPDRDFKEIVSSNYIIEKKNEKRKEAHGAAPGVYEGEKLAELRTRLLGEERRPVIMSRCMKLISRQLILDNLRYLEYSIRMAEDVNIMLPCLLDADRLTILEDCYFYHYRTIGDSMSHGFNRKLLDNIKLDYDTFLGIMQDKAVANGKEQMDREYVRLLFVVMKNALRASDENVVKLVKDIFGQGDIAELVKTTPVSVSEKSNQLIYYGMKHPVTPVIIMIKMILSAFDKVTAG
ncbi:glycosyltransferase family 2 protein [Butyrivibrio sp. JL13D10]|uniref:glycosyltransferase family 2 protein n=1 Tax=Butyrivibrio sp. JL13D10 TaxID=3236815 RepID=UPI0038B69544